MNLSQISDRFTEEVEKTVRWVLWQKNSDDRYTLRKGRYATKTAAEDAVKNLATDGTKMLVLPEDVEPQVNKRVSRS
jgi:septal ring-binding cell division protein DamX